MTRRLGKAQIHTARYGRLRPPGSRYAGDTKEGLHGMGSQRVRSSEETALANRSDWPPRSGSARGDGREAVARGEGAQE